MRKYIISAIIVALICLIVISAFSKNGGETINLGKVIKVCKEMIHTLQKI